MKFTRALGLLAILGLIGCNQAAESLPPQCPAALIVSEAATITKFRAGPGRDLTDVTGEALLANLRAECAFDRRGVTMQLTMEVIAALGPANRERRLDLQYFVAVVDSTNTVVARETFPIQFTFAANQSRLGRGEEIEPRIPVADRARLAGHRVLIGFVMTADELAYSRRGRN